MTCAPLASRETRKHFAWKALASTLAILMAWGAMPVYAVSQTDFRIYTGEDCFRGIFFGTGPVANLLPRLWDDPRFSTMPVQTPQQLRDSALSTADQLDTAGLHTEANQARDVAARLNVTPANADASPHRHMSPAFESAVIAQIKAASPQYFVTFGADVQSGMQPRVAAAIRDAGARYLAAVDTLVPFPPSTIAAENQWINIYDYVAFVEIAAVVILAIVIVLVAIQAPGGSSGFQFDTVVNNITYQLDPNVPHLPATSGHGALLLGFGVLLAAWLYFRRRGTLRLA